MGDIGTERREVEFEPLTEDPVAEPATDPETEPAPAPSPEPGHGRRGAGRPGRGRVALVPGELRGYRQFCSKDDGLYPLVHTASADRGTASCSGPSARAARGTPHRRRTASAASTPGTCPAAPRSRWGRSARWSGPWPVRHRRPGLPRRGGPDRGGALPAGGPLAPRGRGAGPRDAGASAIRRHGSTPRPGGCCATTRRRTSAPSGCARRGTAAGPTGRRRRCCGPRSCWAPTPSWSCPALRSRTPPPTGGRCWCC